MDNPYLESFVIRRAEWKRRLKAFAVASFASFLMLNLLWSVSTSRYLAKNRIGLGKIDTGLGSSQDNQEAIEEVVASVWQQGTTHEELREHLLRLKGLDPKDEETQVDTEQVLQAINYQLVEKSGRYQLLLTLDGSGSVVERRLIDRIGIKMASRLAVLPIEKFMLAQERFSNQPDLVSRFASRLKTPIQAVRNAAAQANVLASQLSEAQSENELTKQVQFSRSQQNQMEVASLESQLAQLQQRQAELNGQRERLSGLPESEPRIQVLTRELLGVADLIARLDTQIALKKSKLEREPSPFRNASFRTKSVNSVALSNERQAIDLADSLSRLDRELVRLQNQSSESSLVAERPAESLPVPVFVSSFDRARIVPRDGVHFLGPFLLLCMVSGLIGSVIAWKYRPLIDDIGFESRQQISETLRVPIVAEFKQSENQEADPPEELPWPNLCVKAAELIVLTALAMIACMILFSPSIRASFAENPMHGLAEIMWKIQGK